MSSGRNYGGCHARTGPCNPQALTGNGFQKPRPAGFLCLQTDIPMGYNRSMTTYNVPFIPHPGYLSFLNRNRSRIGSVYFSLLDGPVLDSRRRFQAMETEQLAMDLSKFPVPARYCLLNTRMLHPDLYFSPDFTAQLRNAFETLLNRQMIDGIVFCDFYLLNVMSRALGDLASHLEAVPGINAMIDGTDKADACLDMISCTSFRSPGKITLDRSLNRNPDRLARVSGDLRAKYPGMAIELIANEGCLYHCPFKPAHDAHISLSNCGLSRERTWEMNREAGCVAHLLSHPEQILRSPFIRPEDIHRYKGVADSVKLCGRTLGAGFLEKTLTAYFSERFDGNLLEILDAAEWMSAHYHINNEQLGNNFYKLLTTCTKACKTCDCCSRLFSRTARRKKQEFKQYRDLI